jgi:hypothetical protein
LRRSSENPTAIRGLPDTEAAETGVFLIWAEERVLSAAHRSRRLKPQVEKAVTSIVTAVAAATVR